MPWGNVAAVFVFEWRRAFTAPRVAWWALLALFPVFIVSLIRFSPLPRQPPPEVWAGFLFALIPMLISMLGTFLWTAPAVSAELERKSWVYLAVRPHGATAVLLGKYLAAVSWVLPAALVGLTISVWIARPAGETWRIWSTIAALTCLSCPAYAALYLVLGTLFPQRAMVISVAYTLVFELVISFIPAIINKLTLQYRLTALFVDWADIPIPPNTPFASLGMLTETSASFHVAALAVYTLALLAAAVALIHWCEFTAAAESEV